jgi:hypothetical protein
MMNDRNQTEAGMKRRLFVLEIILLAGWPFQVRFRG